MEVIIFSFRRPRGPWCRSSLRSRQNSDPLPSELAAELLRGVPVDVCVSRFGEHFRRHSQEDGYPLSQRTHCIDFFLSHDWYTSGWKKTVALLLYFNGVPAAVVTLCICILATGLEWAKQLPGGWATATIAAYTKYLFGLLLLAAHSALLPFFRAGGGFGSALHRPTAR